MLISEYEDAITALCEDDIARDPFTGVEMALPIEAYAAYAYLNSESVESAEAFSAWRGDAEDSYAGEYRSDREFAMEMADQIGAIDSEAQWPYSCIDWDQAARELMMDYSEEWNHYFRL